MHRTHLFLASIFAIVSIAVLSLFGSISQGPPGQMPLAQQLMQITPLGLAATFSVVAVAILSVGLGLALFAKSELGGRTRRSPIALLMWTIAGKSRQTYRALGMFFMPHVHNSRLQSVSALR